MPEIDDMPERYSRVWPGSPAAREAAARVDWPARFRAAAEAADNAKWVTSARDLRNIARDLDGDMPAGLTEAIGRALLGEDA